jgi:hypothetical protein
MPNVTSMMQTFESPFKKSIYSRNVWDMQVFNNKIYIGQGDSGINTGLVPITSFDPSTTKFTTEGMIDGEQ